MKEKELFASSEASGSARRVCVRCGRSLPLESFYRTGPSRRPDAYCKACRRALASRFRARRSMERVSEVFRLRQRPLITTTDDPVLRRRLLFEALSFVKASKYRRRMKSARREDRRIDREIAREEQERIRDPFSGCPAGGGKSSGEESRDSIRCDSVDCNLQRRCDGKEASSGCPGDAPSGSGTKESPHSETDKCFILKEGMPSDWGADELPAPETGRRHDAGNEPSDPEKRENGPSDKEERRSHGARR